MTERDPTKCMVCGAKATHWQREEVPMWKDALGLIHHGVGDLMQWCDKCLPRVDLVKEPAGQAWMEQQQAEPQSFTCKTILDRYATLPPDMRPVFVIEVCMPGGQYSATAIVPSEEGDRIFWGTIQNTLMQAVEEIMAFVQEGAMDDLVKGGPWPGD